MKRAATGGAHRGPVAPTRQHRTIRLMQVLLVVAAGALFMFAGYSWGRATGFDEARDPNRLEAPRRPGAVQVVVLAGLGLGALGAAYWLGGPEGVRIPTPAGIDDIAGRKEAG